MTNAPLNKDIHLHTFYNFSPSIFDPESKPNKATKENIKKWQTYLEMVKSFAEKERQFIPALNPDEFVRQACEKKTSENLIMIYFRSEQIGYLSWDESGFVVNEHSYNIRKELTVLLKQVWIKPEYRQRGIFKRVMKLFPDLISPSLYIPHHVIRMIASFPSLTFNETAGAVLKHLGFQRSLTDYRKDFPKKRGIHFKTVCLDDDPPVLPPFDVVASEYGNKCGDAFRLMIEEFYAGQKGKDPKVKWADITKDFQDGLCHISLVFDETALIGYVLWQGQYILQAWLKREYRGKRIYKRFIDLLPDLCFLETGETFDYIRAGYPAINSDRQSAGMYEHLGFEKMETDNGSFYQLSFPKNF